MQFSSNKRRRAPSVIIVSLIDVLLVVLIFLMVSTTFKKSQNSLKLTLPESSQAKAGPTEQKPFMILIASNTPYFYLDGKPVTFERLKNEIDGAVKLDPKLKVTIKADKNAPLGEYVRIIDAATAAKVGGITLQTEKPGR